MIEHIPEILNIANEIAKERCKQKPLAEIADAYSYKPWKILSMMKGERKAKLDHLFCFAEWDLKIWEILWMATHWEDSETITDNKQMRLSWMAQEIIKTEHGYQEED